MGASGWKHSKTYCYKCGTWLTHISHKQCRRGSVGSEVLLNIDFLQEKCTKCGEIWPLENSVLYCSCGNVQRTEYIDSVAAMGHDDRIILEEGNLVYILRSTGVVVVAQRTFPGITVDNSPRLVSQGKSNKSKGMGCFQVIGCLVVILIVFGLGIGLFQFFVAHSASSYTVSNLKALAPNSQLASYKDNQGNQHIDYIGADKHVHELSYNGAQWTNVDTMVGSKGVDALAGSVLDGYPGSGGGRHVNYISTNHHVHELFLSGSHWVNHDLTAAGQGKAAANGSALVGYIGSVVTSEHVNYIGSNHHVYELFFDGSNWVNNDLTALSNGVTAIGGSALAGYTGTDGSMHINYTGSDQHIHELYFNNGWSDNDLTVLGGGQKAASGGALIGYWGSDNSVHVNYIGSDQHIHELYFNPQASHWSDNDLTTASGGTSAADKSALADYRDSQGNQHIDYIGTDSHIDELSFNSSWSSNDLTAMSKALPPLAGSTLTGLGSTGSSGYITYVGTDHSVYTILT